MIIGIDLGTTNSLVAYWNSDEPVIIPNALGEVLTPSVISLNEDDSIIIGKPALYRLVTTPELAISNFKRYMGSDKVFKLGNYSFRAEELSALILKQLKEDAEHFLGCAVVEAVISVPAYFSDVQRKATKAAGKLAGLKVERLINEPTAAGIAYGIQEQANEINYLILDLGGGTFDASILTIFSGIIEVRASSGDNHLGGADFTEILKELFLEDLNHKLNLSGEFPIQLKQKIYEQAEVAKHRLSIDQEVTMKIEWNHHIHEYKINIKEFEKYSELLLERIRKVVEKVLRDSKLTSTQIEQAILVGGATRMPLVRNLVGRMFGKIPRSHINPDTVVARGVAIQAALKEQHKALDEIIVTDVCPYSLGIAVATPSESPNTEMGSARFDPIIERNTVIPTSRSRIYYPIHPNQTHVEVKIYQGEDFFVDKNVFLGKLNMSLKQDLKDPAIEVRFTYDINGLLEVETTILETKEMASIVIEGNPGALTEEQINAQIKALQKIKIHPRDEIENILLINQAERLYIDLQGEKRIYLANAMTEFLGMLNTQDLRTIAQARNRFEKILLTLQPDHYLV